MAPEITEAGRGSCGSETGGWLHRGNRAAAKSVTRTFQNSESARGFHVRFPRQQFDSDKIKDAFADTLEYRMHLVYRMRTVM